MSTVRERVERGAAYLDTIDPCWYQRIRVGQLDLSSTCSCVLGQLAYDKLEVHQKADPWPWLCRVFRIRQRVHGDDVGGLRFAKHSDYSLGFTIRAISSREDIAWRHLTRQWKRLILGRLEAEL